MHAAMVWPDLIWFRQPTEDCSEITVLDRTAAAPLVPVRSRLAIAGTGV
jgi:hypothetical protein